MSEPYVWGALPRAVNDPTVIDQAIETAVAAHNDDPDAHLGEDQALQSHRAAEIIDHAAESVVNDKIVADARAYTAIVDPTTEYDYATIESALAYVVSKGGGTILVKAGEHFIDEQLNIPRGVSFTGEGVGVTNIYCTATDVPNFNLAGSINENTAYTRFENISFVRVNGFVFSGEAQVGDGYHGIRFEGCSFEGGGRYGVNITDDFQFDNCQFFTSTTAALSIVSLYMRNCIFVSDVAGIACVDVGGLDFGAHIIAYDCEFESSGSKHIDGSITNSMFINCNFSKITKTLPAMNSSCVNNTFTNCQFLMSGDNNAEIDAIGVSISQSIIDAEDHESAQSKILLRSSSTNCRIINNSLVKTPANSGAGNLISNNVIIVTVTPPPVTGESLIYTTLQNDGVDFSSGVVNRHITKDGNYAFGALGGVLTQPQIWHWDGSEWDLLNATQIGSGYTIKSAGASRDGTKYFVCAQETYINYIQARTYVRSGNSVTVRNHGRLPTSPGWYILAINNAGNTVILKSATTNAFRLATISGNTVTMGSDLSLPNYDNNGSPVAIGVSSASFSEDDTRIYFGTTGISGIAVCTYSGTSISHVQTIQVYWSGGAQAIAEKSNKSLLLPGTSGLPFRELTYVSGAYSDSTVVLNPSLPGSSIVAIGQIATDGSVAVVTSGGRLLLARLATGEYTFTETYESMSTSFIATNPIDGNSGNIAQPYASTKAYGKAEFD